MKKRIIRENHLYLVIKKEITQTGYWIFDSNLEYSSKFIVYLYECFYYFYIYYILIFNWKRGWGCKLCKACLFCIVQNPKTPNEVWAIK